MKKKLINIYNSLIRLFSYSLIPLFAYSPVHAAEPVPVTTLGTIGGEGLGPFGNLNFGSGEAGGVLALRAITGAVSSIIGLMTITGVIWFLFQFIIGGYLWLHSGGDKQKLQEARDRITNAFVGLLIVVSGWSILALIGIFFGIDAVIKQPDILIRQLKINAP